MTQTHFLSLRRQCVTLAPLSHFSCPPGPEVLSVAILFYFFILLYCIIFYFIIFCCISVCMGVFYSAAGINKSGCMPVSRS